jgi:hypothetical protein
MYMADADIYYVYSRYPMYIAVIYYVYGKYTLCIWQMQIYIMYVADIYYVYNRYAGCPGECARLRENIP